MVNPPSLLDACTVDGRVYCAPVNIHPWQWIWISNKVFEDAGLAIPTNRVEFAAAVPTPRDNGIIPLALGGQPWQSSGPFNVLMVALAGPELLVKVYGDGDT